MHSSAMLDHEAKRKAKADLGNAKLLKSAGKDKGRYDLALEALAKSAFEAYNAQGPNPNKTFDGRDVPPWEQTSDQVRGKWKAAVLDVLS